MSETQSDAPAHGIGPQNEQALAAASRSARSIDVDELIRLRAENAALRKLVANQRADLNEMDQRLSRLAEDFATIRALLRERDMWAGKLDDDEQDQRPVQ
jgi:hypothetical protein